MTLNKVKSIAGLIGVISGNYLYQLFMDTADYNSALERSYFQVIAVLIIYFFSVEKKNDN